MGVNKTLLPDEEEKDILSDPNSPAIGETETGGTTVADVTNGVTSGLTGVGSTAQPIVALPSYKGEMPSYEAWMSENGYDPDRDYYESKAALEYDYETSMATYGRRAEELAQMGLSNSGLSDVYQLGAFNAYLKSQNDLANQKIAAKKKYKQEYNALVEQREGFRQTDSANAYNLGLSLYDGSNIDFVRQQLTQQGYDASIVDSAIASLSALDVNTLPAVKAQQEKDAADVDSAFQAWAKNYKVEDKDKISAYYRANNWSEDKIKKLTDQLDAYAGAAGTDEGEAAAIDQLIAAVAIAVPEYDGSETAKNNVMNYLKSQGSSQYYDQVIAGLATNMGAEADAIVTDTINKPTGEVTTDELVGTLDKIGEKFGTNSKEYKEAQDKVSNKTNDTITWALEKNDHGIYVRLGSEEVANALGMNLEEWANADDGKRLGTIVDYAGQLRKDGLLSDSNYGDLVDDWIHYRTDKAITDDNDNMEASGMRDAGAIAWDLIEWRKSGYITDSEYSNFIDALISDFGFERDSKGNINWYKSVNGAEGHVEYDAGDTPAITGDRAKEVIDYAETLRKTGAIHDSDYVVYNGELYYVYFSGDARKVYKPDFRMLSFTGDGIVRATDEEKRGIYDIVTRIIESYQKGSSGGADPNPGGFVGGSKNAQISTRQ
jgi:hypothetical protein